MGIFRRKTEAESSRSDIEQDKAELEVEAALMHVKILTTDLMGALDKLETAINRDTTNSDDKDAPTEPKETHEPPF